MSNEALILEHLLAVRVELEAIKAKLAPVRLVDAKAGPTVRKAPRPEALAREAARRRRVGKR